MILIDGMMESSVDGRIEDMSDGMVEKWMMDTLEGRALHRHQSRDPSLKSPLNHDATTAMVTSSNVSSRLTHSALQ